MKKKLFYLFALICSMSLFTACSDDDEVILPVEQDMAGSYKGALEIAVNNTTVTPGGIPQKVYISKSTAGNNQLKLELKNFSFGSLNLGDIQVDPCAVTEQNGTYTFAGKQTLTLAAPLGSCPVTVTGTIKGSAISINIGVEVAALNQDVVATFEGTKLTGSESTEAAITGFTFDSEFVTEQPVINEENGTITFKVSDAATDDVLKALVPTITISEKATVTPSSGVAVDFSAGKSVTYTVIAEDGTDKVYVASISGKNVVIKYDFEEWTVDKSQSDEPSQYPIIGADYKNAEWATCNAAVLLVKSLGILGGITYTGGWAINPTDESHSGTKAVEMVSIDTQGGNIFGTPVPKVTAGTAFLGSFDAFAALEDPMATTLFGIQYTKKPLQVKGYFSYAPGDKFYNADGALDETAKDACSMSAVLYEVSDYKETLNGSTIYTSEKIVAQAVYTYSKKTEGYLPFDLKLEYVKEYDATKKYKFAIIFSASKDGAAYKAAVGSRLLIDDVTIINE